MLGVQVLEIAAHDAGRKPLDDILETALRERKDLVLSRRTFDRVGDELDRRTAVYGQEVDQRFERDALCGLHAPVLTRALLVVGPRDLGVRSQRREQHFDEAV